ncbi:DUF1295 domain-containing protein [Rathayibacter soli]|uniref:DUF1295 domain-containing protein n=1 Tax=Rathayibacter soli TaxID=3144168 RepID=UPI0027E4F3A7|nr:DUF1295 domain-containing protein [Glaciibacter superstes]
MEALTVCVWIVALACLATWVLSVLTHEHSWVDRVWSVMPVIYLWVFAIGGGMANPRGLLMAGLATAWGARLTFNFARKGGYRRGGEDYRWVALRSRMHPLVFAAFNLFFISIYQNLLLFLITLPALTALQHPTGLGVLDVVAGVAFIAFLIGETIADQQQWKFQSWKAAEIAAGRSPRPRFLQSGLFRYSRHPNFFCEIAQWWIIFAFGAIAAGSVLQWTALGAMLLTVLFIGSTIFTERISRSRYPEYAAYQQTTSPIIPWRPRVSSVAAREAGLP